MNILLNNSILTTQINHRRNIKNISFSGITEHVYFTDAEGNVVKKGDIYYPYLHETEEEIDSKTFDCLGERLPFDKQKIQIKKPKHITIDDMLSIYANRKKFDLAGRLVETRQK